MERKQNVIEIPWTKPISVASKNPKQQSPRKKQPTRDTEPKTLPAGETHNWQIKEQIKGFKTLKQDVMIVSVNREITYTDILRKVQTDSEIKEQGEEVNKIRRTQKDLYS